MIPVLIGGCDRSGTTLLGALLGNHSECLCVPESQFKLEMVRYADWGRDDVDIAHVLSKINDSFRFKLWGLDIDEESVPVGQIRSSYKELMSWIVKQYGKKYGKPNPSIWIDHTPSNTRYASTLFELLPEARIIHIVRDGRAVASSLMKLEWGPCTINNAARYWVEKVAYGLAAELFWGEKRVQRITYEELVQNPETTLEKICCWLNINYQKDMIRGSESEFVVPRYTRNQHALVGKEPNVKRTSAWKNELTPRQIEVFENLTGDFLSHLGYTLSYGAKAIPMTKLERRLLRIQETLKRHIINKIRYRCRIKRTFGSPVADELEDEE